MQLITQYPLWFIILCPAAGILYAWFLYHKSRFKEEQGRNTLLKLMSGLRFLSVTLLTFLLLAPLIRYLSETIEKPVIIMALDDSQSVTANKDSAYYRKQFIADWNALGNKLSDKYKMKFLYVGGETHEADSGTFNQKKTNLSNLFDYVNATYARENLGAVVLASDGIYNKGTNPVYKTFKFKAPVYTVGLGDTAVRRDIMIRSVNANSIAYLGNEFPVMTEILANDCKGQSVNVTVSDAGKTVFSKIITIDDNTFFTEIPVTLPADKPGTKHLVVTVSGVSGEVTRLNNRKDVFVEVIDGREKILIVYNSPHPDVAAIKEAIADNKNYEVLAVDARSVNAASLSDYSLVILHQLPSRNMPDLTIMNQLRTNRIPMLTIIGTQSLVEQLGRVSASAAISKNGGRWSDAQPVGNTSFNAFTVGEELTRAFDYWPPLKSPYGNYAQAEAQDVLVWQKIGSVVTRQPLLAFSQYDAVKSGWLYGEGIWKWRLTEYATGETHAPTNELFSKIVQYLTVKDDKRKFRVMPLKSTFDEDETVQFTAEVYNGNYELVNDRDVQMTVKNEAGREYKYNFTKTNNSYSLDIGVLASGRYSYVARVAGGTKEEMQSGMFTVTPLQMELTDTRANHDVLRSLSSKYNGKLLLPSQLQSLDELIRKNETIKPVAYSEIQLKDLVNMKWVFVLLLLLLGSEWFLRKREGGY